MLFSEKQSTFTRYKFLAFCEKYVRENAVVKTVMDPDYGDGKGLSGLIHGEIEITLPVTETDVEFFKKREKQGDGFFHYSRRGNKGTRAFLNREHTAIRFIRYINHAFDYRGCKTEESRIAKWEREWEKTTCLEKEVFRQEDFLNKFVECFAQNVKNWNFYVAQELESKLSQEHVWKYTGTSEYTEAEDQEREKLEQKINDLQKQLDQTATELNALKNAVSVRRQQGLARTIANCEPGILPESITGEVQEKLQNGTYWQEYGSRPEDLFF